MQSRERRSPLCDVAQQCRGDVPRVRGRRLRGLDPLIIYPLRLRAQDDAAQMRPGLADHRVECGSEAFCIRGGVHHDDNPEQRAHSHRMHPLSRLFPWGDTMALGPGRVLLGGVPRRSSHPCSIYHRAGPDVCPPIRAVAWRDGVYGCPEAAAPRWHALSAGGRAMAGGRQAARGERQAVSGGSRYG